MKIDTEKEGLETVLRPWQAELMRRIWRVGETDSSAAYAHLQGTETPTSRASTINFLDMMAEEGFLAYREVTAKGGRKRIYRPSPRVPDEEAFRRALADRLKDRAKNKAGGDVLESDE